MTAAANDRMFVPRRAASWWTRLEDIQWSQKAVVDRIKRRAEGFAKAGIDTAINFGFHIRFDFADYFGPLHGYYANVCEELHRYDIRFMEHYSCNHVERPRGDQEWRALQRQHRHHVLLFHDPAAAAHAQYEGHYFNDLCEVDLRDGTRGYAEDYKLEVFCHSNPGFLDMHRKYLLRLMKEVPFDGIQVDDMCDYAGLHTCGCRYCRERFKKEYGHEIPAFGSGYADPVFRDWLRMKSDAVADHLKMIKDTVGNIPLMTCCSNAGPLVLNTIALNLDKMAPWLDFFMLENVGINVETVDWTVMDAEALYQKDVAAKKGGAPAIAISYTIYEQGAYLGWCLSRFWGVSNWSSTLYGRLEEDPADAMEIEEMIGPYNNWEKKHSHTDDGMGKDFAEVRLVTSAYCRDNGWRGADGHEQWDRVKAWSALLLRHNIGYRLLRCEELSDGKALGNEQTPLILDGIACVSDSQLGALRSFLEEGGEAWMALPFGTLDEKGFERKKPLSEALLEKGYRRLRVLGTALDGDPLRPLMAAGRFRAVLRQLSGNRSWAARIRYSKGGPAIHFMNRGLVAEPHPVLKEASGMAVLQGFHSDMKDNRLVFEYDTRRIGFGALSVMSPELGEEGRAVAMRSGRLEIDLSGVGTYAVVQPTA